MSSEEIERKLATIFSADSKGISHLTGEGETGALQVLISHREVIVSLIGKHGGFVVDFPGDTVIAEFPNVINALQCAVKTQEEMAERNMKLPEETRMPYQIGIHFGEVIEEEGKIHGDAIDVASWLKNMADAGGICISGSVYEQVKNELDVDYEPLGEQSVESVAEPVHAGSLVMPNSLAVHPMEGADGDSQGRPSPLVLRRYKRFAAGDCDGPHLCDRRYWAGCKYL